MATTVHSTKEIGLKARIAEVLKGCTDTCMTLGDLSRALGLPKTEHPALSATLIKLRDEGRVKFKTGESKSAKGPRFVKCYSWKPDKTPASTPTPASDDRRFLSFCQ